MSILGRYVLRQIAGSIVLILASLTGVTWIAVALRQLDLMTTQGQGVFEFLKLTSMALPSLVAFIAPLAVIIACLHVLNRLNTDSELIVMTAGGSSTLRLLRPFLLVGLVMSALVAAINHLVAPAASLALRDRAQDIRSELVGQVIQAGRFTEPESNVTMHIRDRGSDGALLGLLIRDAREKAQISTYFAERGYLRKQDDATYLLMETGQILRQKSASDPGESVLFDRYAVDLNRLEQKSEAITALKPREMTTAALFEGHAKAAAAPPSTTPGRFLSEAHDRSATALFPIAFVLIALAVSGQARTTRQTRTRALVMGFAIAVGVRLLGIAAANAVIVRPRNLPVMYAVPILTALVSLGLIVFNQYPRRQPLFVRKLGDAWTGFSGRVSALVKPRPAAKTAAAHRSGRS